MFFEYLNIDRGVSFDHSIVIPFVLLIKLSDRKWVVIAIHLTWLDMVWLLFCLLSEHVQYNISIILNNDNKNYEICNILWILLLNNGNIDSCIQIQRPNQYIFYEWQSLQWSEKNNLFETAVRWNVLSSELD